MKKIKILIIGGTGFIGFHLAKKCLKKNFSVTCLHYSKLNKIRRIKKINYLKCDVTNLKALRKKLKNKKFDHLINCSGYVFFNKYNKLAYKNHYKGAVNLYKIFKKGKLKSFVQIGSSLEYGKCKVPNKENYFCHPEDFYGYYKLKTTNFLLNKFKFEQFPAVILRFYQVYGPNQEFNRFIPQMIRSSLLKKEFQTTKGEQFRDFLFIEDATIAIIKSMLQKKAAGEIINIGYGKPYKLKRLMNIVKKHNKFLKPIYGKIKKNERKILYPNILKAKKILKWKPKNNIEAGIKKTINSYKKFFKYNQINC